MRTRILLVVLLLALVAPPLARAAGERPIASLSGQISDERITTYWAYAAERWPVRMHTRNNSRMVDRLHLVTEDGFPEVYLVLAQVVYPHRTWFRIRLPGRPNGRTGWVPEGALSNLHVTHKHVVVNENNLTLTLYVWGRRLFSAPVGIGKPDTPTPTGNYWIREKFPVDPPDGFYGPYAFGTADYSTLSEWPNGGVVGIHGTTEPWLIPGQPSHGCIRMINDDISRLWDLLPVGVPVSVS